MYAKENCGYIPGPGSVAQCQNCNTLFFVPSKNRPWLATSTDLKVFECCDAPYILWAYINVIKAGGDD